MQHIVHAPEIQPVACLTPCSLLCGGPWHQMVLVSEEVVPPASLRALVGELQQSQQVRSPFSITIRVQRCYEFRLASLTWVLSRKKVPLFPSNMGTACMRWMALAANPESANSKMVHAVHHLATLCSPSNNIMAFG